MDNTVRPLHIEGADGRIAEATISGPEAHFTDFFHGFEDYHNPRLKRLRQKYRIGEAVRGETREFRKFLKLRHWIHSRWPIDNSQPFGGDAFAILEKAKTGAGFHCSHCMVVQEAVFSAFGFVARNLGVDRSHRDLGHSAHHGVNEVWSNAFAKWVLLDAKYDIHFERDGIPLSALELHEAVRADGGRGVEKRKGVNRRRVSMEDPKAVEGTIRSYWWVSYHTRQDTFTQPHWAGGSRLVVLDNAPFRRTTWYRQNGNRRVKHWAYAADAFLRTQDRHQIEWTPGVPALQVRQASPGTLSVRLRSATPNFKAYRVRIDGGAWRSVTSGQVRWRLREGTSRLEAHTRNLFGVDGPVVTATVRR